MKFFKRLFTLIAVQCLCIACGSATNFNGLITGTKEKQSVENLIAAAYAAYDGGRFLESRAYAAEALNIDPFSENASVAYGYASLALSGLDVFVLAKTMTKSTSSGNTSAAGSVDSSNSTTGVLSKLQTVLGLKDEDIAAMSTKDVADPELPVLIPVCAEVARELVDPLLYVNDAIAAVCPFVDSEVINASDSRHRCTRYKGIIRQKAKAHFLWAFSHLTEALAFNFVLTYSSTSGSNGSGKTNLEKRVAKIQQSPVATPEELTNLITNLKSVETTVAAILPVGSVCSKTAPTSQLKAMVSDMLAVDAAFKRIAGIPENMTGAITKSMEKISQLQSSTSTTEANSAQSAALKAQMTKNLSTTLNSKLEEMSAAGTPISDSEKASVCSSYSSIAGSSDPATLPTLCK